MKQDRLPRKSKLIQQFLENKQELQIDNKSKKKQQKEKNQAVEQGEELKKQNEEETTNRKKRMKMYWQAQKEKKKIKEMESKLKQELVKANLHKNSKRKLAEPRDEEDENYDEDEEEFDAKIRQEVLEDLDVDFALKGYDNVEYQEVVEQPIRANEFAGNKIAKPQKMQKLLQSNVAKEEQLRKSIVDQYRELKKLKEESKANKKKGSSI